MLLPILKIVFLFVAFLYGISMTARLKYKNPISNGHIFMLTIGIVGFIVLQFNLL